jgi:hypothetical protein
MAFHLAPPHRIIGSDGFRVFTPPHCCGPATYFCLQTSPGYSLLLADVQPIFTYYSTFASPGAKDLRIGQAKPIAPPRPPQTPAASSKSPYRKCPGGTHLWTHAAARRRRICDRELRFFANLSYNSALRFGQMAGFDEAWAAVDHPTDGGACFRGVAATTSTGLFRSSCCASRFARVEGKPYDPVRILERPRPNERELLGG